MQRLIMLLVWTGLLISTRASAFDKPPFPRLAAHWTANQHYEDPNIQKQLARGSVALIAVWPNWGNVEQAIEGIKAVNPKTLVFNYIINNEIPADRASYANIWGDLYTKLDTMNWWLYASGTCCTVLNSPWPGALAINNTLFTHPDSNGDHWPEWFAKWVVSKYSVPNPSLDGFYMDNFTYKPMMDGDWNIDGTSDEATATTQTWIRQAYRKQLDVLHQQMPGKFQLGNIANWGDPNAVLTEYQGQLNGGLMEGLIGYSWSVETWGGWQQLMAWYRKSMNALAEPKLGLFAQVGDVTDYQSFRYGFTSCLMDDGYFVFNSMVSGDAPWFDEYQAVLGNSTSSPATSAWQNGVYRRDFANGIALVNPKGNGAQTVTLEGDFKRISGTQAPAVNSGQTVRTLTLQDRDGIILMRLQPQSTSSTKSPAPPSSIKVQ